MGKLAELLSHPSEVAPMVRPLAARKAAPAAPAPPIRPGGCLSTRRPPPPCLLQLSMYMAARRAKVLPKDPSLAFCYDMLNRVSRRCVVGRLGASARRCRLRAQPTPLHRPLHPHLAALRW